MPDAAATRVQLDRIAPFFIVRDVMAAVAFYRDRLGFDVTFLGPADDPFVALLSRDGASLMLKAITPDVAPTPNSSRHAWARWDAYVFTRDPDGLAAELESRGVSLHEPLGVNSDNLRGFEIADVDGYVLYFGRPAEMSRPRA